MKKSLVLFVLFTNSILSKAPVISQNITTPVNYPKGYFRNPLGIPIQLAANFGELRTNHFHMGFDIRTNQKENLPVYAAADGYVSRIKIERFGFGHAIYITHPNGYTTLYAHLNDFYPALQSYIKDKQYAEQKWEQEITFEPTQFPVKKGEFIAFSGNTGGSQGSHLHFEIRDTKTGNNLNPWLFDFGLKDNISPSIYKLYFFDRRNSTYVGNPVTIPIKGAGENYTTRDAVVTLSSPYISFGISAEDKTTAASFRFGVYEASLYVDDSLYAGFQLNNISYDDTRYVNGSIDYKTRLSGGGYIQHLSRLPGNLSSIFSNAGDGTVLLTDSFIHRAKILVNDAGGNSCVLAFRFKWDPSKATAVISTANTITMKPGEQNIFKTNDVEAIFSDKAFYDTVPFVYKAETSNDTRVVSAIHYLANYRIPVHDSFTVRIKPVVTVSDSLKDRIVMQMISNRKEETAKGFWSDGFLEAKFRDLGAFKLVVDTIVPKISLVGWINGSKIGNKKSITLVATDAAGELKSFNAYIDDQWALFSRKSDSFIHTFDEKTLPGNHTLHVVVEDIAGNIIEKKFTFIR